MSKRLLCLAVVFVSSLAAIGCSSTGPLPNSAGFVDATKSLPAAKSSVYTSSASWYPNTLLGGIESFHAPSTYGRLFIGADQLTFAIYDEPTNTLLQAYQVNRSDVQWLTIKDHGLSRIARLQSGNTVNSFAFIDGENMAGQAISKDTIASFLRVNYNKR